MKLKSHWERITDNTWRMCVPGGWLVKTMEDVSYRGVSTHMVMIPDQNHEWELLEEDDEG
jgi:hypothetical protein